MTSTASTNKKKAATVTVLEEGAAPYPDMSLCQQIHLITTQSASSSAPEMLQLRNTVFTKIATELENPSLYRKLITTLYGDIDMDSTDHTDHTARPLLTNDSLQAMEDKNDTVWKTLEQKLADAKVSAGDMELMDARIKMARFAAKSLSKTQALQAYQDIIDTPKIGTGKKIDAYMESARIAGFYGDTAATDKYIEQAVEMAGGSGGDWDRRNRLKVYRALQQLLHRDLKQASTLLLDCIATFSCNEICTYSDFIVYLVLTNLLHLPRPDLKSKILDGPEILSVAKDIPIVIRLVRSFYETDYKTFLHAMLDLEQDVLLKDRFLQPHAAFWMRELHILAYKQFLDAYQSVTLSAMASAFGVSTDFIDYHASRFIAANRLSAKIDKFGGVIVTNRADLKNAQYREMIQKGDLLLNRIQKLSRVVDL